MTTTGNTVAATGLGVMGAPMAANLIDAGYDVVGFNRSPGKVETRVARGGRRASSIDEAVEGADAVLTALLDTPTSTSRSPEKTASSRMRKPARCRSARAPSARTRRSVSRPSAAATASVPWTLLCPAVKSAPLRHPDTPTPHEALRHDGYLSEQRPV